MNLTRRDYALAMAGYKMAGLFRGFGDVESDVLRRRLRAIEIDRPVFVTGLARSGTTLMLNLLASFEGVATHRYRDFPFLWTPVTWSGFVSRFARERAPVERPHRDWIKITMESPDAFEEPIWQSFMPWLHDPERIQVLDSAHRAPDFEDFFRDHIRKIILVRRGERYVSKGNYNVGRIGFLARVFPTARFVIPLRSPMGHVHSLVKQHRLFSGYADEDPRVSRYLRATGHYEFGPQRHAINFGLGGAELARAEWEADEEHAGYANMWAEVYGYVDGLRERSDLRDRLILVRYEDFCADPPERFAAVRRFLELDGVAPGLDEQVAGVSAPPDQASSVPQDTRQRVLEITGEVASRFGYA